MPSLQLRTALYSDDARDRLGRAVTEARVAAGYPFRTSFINAYRDQGVKSLRSLELLETGQPGVGQKFLFAVAAVLPGWDLDTPRRILEGGDPPPPAKPSTPGRPADESALADDEEDRLIAGLIQLDFTPEQITDAIKKRRAHKQQRIVQTRLQPGETAS